MDGHFVFRPFQVVLTLGVMIYFYNALFAVYYVLPTDVNKRKFIPGGCMYVHSHSVIDSSHCDVLCDIAGLASLLSKCMSKDQADSAVLRCVLAFSTLVANERLIFLLLHCSIDCYYSGALCCKTFSHFAEMLLDGLLLCLATVSCVVSSIMLERAAQFDYTYKGARESLYFTLGSFYSTFTQTVRYAASCPLLCVFA